MADEIKITAELREEHGKAAIRRLRAKGLLPGVVYSGGKSASMIQLDGHDFEQLLRHHASESLIMSLQIGKANPRKVLLREVQRHPVNGNILHADFYEISMTQQLQVNIPVELTGTSAGVVEQGGVLEHLLREIEVECIADDIIEHLDVDISALNIGDSLQVEDMNIDLDKYNVLTPMDTAVAAVAAPRVEEEEEEEEEELAEGAEPEVIGEKKEGEEAASAEEGKPKGGK